MPIYTIGYGSRSMGEFIELLKSFQIGYLIDVRSKPYSAFRPEYSKGELERSLTNAAIKYVFMGDLLGGQPEKRSVYTEEGKIDYGKLRELDSYQRGIERLRDASHQGLQVAIMCSEQKPEMCHRSKLIGRSLTEAKIPLEHIDEKGEAVSQEAVLLRLTNGQLSLFGDEEANYTSRKKYKPSRSEEHAEED